MEPFISNEFISVAQTQEKSQCASPAGAPKKQNSWNRAGITLALACSAQPSTATTVGTSGGVRPERVRKGPKAHQLWIGTSVSPRRSQVPGDDRLPGGASQQMRLCWASWDAEAEESTLSLPHQPGRMQRRPSAAGFSRTGVWTKDEGGRANRIATEVDSKNEEWLARNMAAKSQQWVDSQSRDLKIEMDWKIKDPVTQRHMH